MLFAARTEQSKHLLEVLNVQDLINELKKTFMNFRFIDLFLFSPWLYVFICAVMNSNAP